MAKYYGYCYNEEGRFTEMIPLDVEYDEENGEENPILPPLCTLLQPPDGIYYPLWTGSNWVKTVDPEPVEPQPEEPSELELLKKQLELTQQALDDLLLGGM